MSARCSCSPPARRSCALPFLTDGSPVHLSSLKYLNATVCRASSAHCSAACRSTPHGLRSACTHEAAVRSCAARPGPRRFFSALQPLQAEERGRYCAFKTAELLYLLSTDSPLLPLPPEAPGRERYQVELMRQVRDHMLAHLADPLTISQLAARFHISPTALKDCFRQAYGRPLHQYLLEHRVRRAAELLSESGLSIVEIASAVGYNSASQFGVAFKRRYQLTPSQFRRMAHSQKELRQDM